MKKKKNNETPLTAREAALRVLERAGLSAPVQSLLDTKLTGGLFSRQDAALTTELVYGYLRSEIRLSWLLSQFMKAPEKLPPP
ncbi:MAG: transcription antitermination factor NusB [Bilophila sp.]